MDSNQQISLIFKPNFTTGERKTYGYHMPTKSIIKQNFVIKQKKHTQKKDCYSNDTVNHRGLTFSSHTHMYPSIHPDLQYRSATYQTFVFIFQHFQDHISFIMKILHTPNFT